MLQNSFEAILFLSKVRVSFTGSQAKWQIRIRSQKGSVFIELPDPDPYLEYGYGSGSKC
jgi:hypothetical protein